MNGIPRLVLQRKHRKPLEIYVTFGPPVAFDGTIILGQGPHGPVVLDPGGAPAEWLDGLIDAALDVHPATRGLREEIGGAS